MKTLTNFTVKAVKKGDEKEGKYGPYYWLNFVTDKHDNVWFDYIPNKNLPELEAGQTVAAMEYEVQQNGDFTNYRVKKLLLEAPAETLQPNGNKGNGTKGATGDLSFYVAYMKDIQVARIEKGIIGKKETLKDLMREVMAAGMDAYNLAVGKTHIPMPQRDDEVDPEFEEAQREEQSDIPF